MLFKQCISVIVSISLLSNQMLFAGTLELDKTATQKTSIETAPNGVPIVNITTPNAQGLSHNKFTNYNVEQKGLILNNATNVVQTQLGGYIASNPNLASQSAKTILNEVTGTNRSLLNGYTEVAGSSADVIIANPNGISINGGGFINTPKVTLSTGKPELVNGQVNGFSVNGGDILIEGEGFNAAANSQVDLYSKVLMLNAKLHAQSLNIVTGENHIASDGTITSQQASGTGVSLDSSALGGIYAQKITLVGTDKGVGVNLPPEVLASNGAINISSDGKITFQKATASESITAASASDDIEVNGALSASADIALRAKESIINNDVITAGLQADGSANTASVLTLQATSITNTKSLYTNGSMNLDASSVVENKDTINALETIQIKTDSLKNSGTLISDKTLNIEAQTNIANDGILSSNKDLSLTAQSADNKGFITAANSLVLSSTNLANTGTIHSNNHLKLTLNSDFNNEGMINSGTDATLLVNGAFINNNTLSAGFLSDGSTNTASSLTIQALTLTNTAKISSLGDVYINASALTNNSYINASNILYTLSDTLSNSGTMYSNAYLILRLTQALTNEGTLSGGKSVDVISNGTVTNTNVIASGLLSDGSINDTATLNLQASDITNTAKISSRGNLNVTASTLTNRGYLSAYNALQVNTATLHNYGVLFSGTDMNLWVSDLLYNYENANILALGNLVMAKDASLAKTKRIVNEKATIETINGDMSLYAETFENKTDGLVKGTKTIHSQTINIGSAPYTQLKVDESILTQAKQELINEGKGTKYSSINIKRFVCTYLNGNDVCLHREDRYNGFSAGLIFITSSNEMYVFNPDDLSPKVNALLSKYNVSASFYDSRRDALFGSGWFYSIPDLQGGERQRQVTVTSQQEYMISKNAPAKLLSGKKLSINADTVTNYLSEISSNDDLTMTGNMLNNGSEVLFQIDTRTGIYDYRGGWAPLPSTTTYTQTDAAYSLIYSAKNITGNLATVNNIDIKSNQSPLGHSATTAVTAQTDSVSVTPVTPVIIDPKTDEKKITLPKDTNGLFVVSTNPKSKYLIETNPAFASFSNFISSDYMLSRLGYNPDATTKRLGDAFYENRLVRDSVFEQTGKRYLDSSMTNDSDQFQYLMNNALAIKDDLKLTPNVGLSNEQIAALTKDIVWMEEREVAGEKVLVPVVYIANVAIERTTDNGAKIVAKEDINLNVENLTNQGDITADGDVNIIASKNIYNEGGAISSAENMTLQAVDGVYNISSELTAKALSINATTFQSDIDSQNITHTYANSGSQNSQLLSEASTINVKDDVTIKTAKNLSIIGTNLDAGGDATLASTDGDIAISSKTHTDTYDFKTRRGYNKGTSTQEISSSITADSISINANNLLVNASDVTAQNDMNIKADNIAITSGENRVYTDSKYKRKGGFMGGGKKTADTIDKKEVVSSTLNAKNLNIDAKSLSIQGSKLTAEQATIASEVIELISLKNSDYESHFSDSSGMMTRTIISKGHIKEEVIPALIQVRDQLIINNKDVTSQLQTENILKTITSQSGLSVEQIKLVEAYAKSEEWDKQMTSLTGMGSIIIAAIVTVCTMGAGTGVVAAAMEGMNAAVQAAVQAAIQSMVVQATTSLVTAAITGNSPVLDASSLIKSAVLAGVTSMANSTFATDALKNDMSAYDYAKNATIRGTVQGVSSEISGGDFKDGFTSGSVLSILNDSSLQMRKYVKDNFDYAGKNGEPVSDGVKSVGVNGDGVKVGGSHDVKVNVNNEITNQIVEAPFGGSQTGDRLIFGIPYAEGGIVDKTVEYFAGPHDFLSSWNYENIDGQTYLKDNGTFVNITSGVLLIPSIPLAVAPFIENNINEINTINYIQEQENKKVENFTNSIKNEGTLNESK